MRTVLTIGREPENDLVINLPIVSGRHARLTWEGVPGQAWIEDLGSSNGTAVGQPDRKITRAIVTANDPVYFGNHAVAGSELLSWVDPSMAPSLLMQGSEMVVGREPGCHRVIDRATISSRHARLKRSGDRILLEDLGSSNGTFVNGQRINEPTEVHAGDLISLGVDSFRLTTGPATVPGTQRLDATKLRPASRPTPTIAVQLDPKSSHSDGLGRALLLLGLLLQAPLLTLLIGGISGSNVASHLFFLSLLALWLGLSTSVFGLRIDPTGPPSTPGSRSWMMRWLILAGLTVVEVVLAEVIAFPMASLKVSGFAALGFLVLAAGVGFLIGLLMVVLAPRPMVAWSALALGLVALGLFGGGPWSLPRSSPVVKLASNLTPSRWAFEGLLISEAEARDRSEPVDLAEAYFPRRTDRMGPKADAMALGSMLIGFLGLGMVLIKFSEGGRSRP